MRLIDADKAIEIWKEKDFIKFVGQEEKAKMLLDVLPTEPRWIPCSGKMPDVNIHVLAQFVMGGVAECYFAHNWWHIVGGFRISGDEVIAWMPLPPCYEPQESEDKE